MLFKKRLNEENLIGIWKHPILASWGSISITSKDGTNTDQPFHDYHDEIFNFKADRTFTVGEYGKGGALYEARGTWRLSADKRRIEFLYDNGESISIDIREFDGRSFITTSIQGNDFKFTKE